MKRWRVPGEILVEAETAEEALDHAATVVAVSADWDDIPRTIAGCWPGVEEVKEDTEDLGPHTVA
jgi:hypothetical protein